MKFRCPNCRQAIEILNKESPATIKEVECPSCHSRFDFDPDPTEAEQTEDERRFIGHYRIIRLLGRGTFGEVFLAWDTELERMVALKIPRPGRISHETRASFLKEARAAAAVSHPNVVTVYEIGEIDGHFYIASEYIDGFSLSAYLSDQVMKPTEAAKMFIKILRGADVFHQRGIVHRDLKPANILLNQQREPFIADFGLARKESSNDVTVTEDGRLIGTIAYMSPEQARGEVSQITHLSDVFSLGVILSEMLTGSRPFRSHDRLTLLSAIISAEPTFQSRKNKARMPRDLRTICEKALEKEPARRYQSAGEMADDLQRFLEGKPILAKPASPAEKGWKWVKRHPALAVCFSVIAVVSGLLVWQLGFRNPVPMTPEVFTQSVVIDCLPIDHPDPSSAIVQWSFLKLDDAREPDPETAVFSTGMSNVTVDLEPGEFLVTASIANFGFHEVYRTVPADEQAASGSLTPTKFEWEGEQVRLPTLNVTSLARSLGNMLFVEGGSFASGEERNPFNPRQSFDVESFYTEANEVTCDLFQAQCPLPAIYQSDASLPQGDAPVVGVTWYLAAHFAEANHRRLLSEFEWEYLATNGGTTTFPWGEDPDLQPEWGLKSVAAPTLDLNAIGVRHLASNAAEMTSSVLTPYPGGKMPPLAASQAKFGYVYRGGPPDLRELADQSWDGEIRNRSSKRSKDESGPNLGFRCGRSFQPRFIDRGGD